ncbi:FISUMP domain-containing protein [Bacteroidota bacterium]
MKHLIAFILFLLVSSSCFAQIDKEFWFVGPEISANHGDAPIYMRISTMDDPANIMLRMPANLKFSPIYELIPPNSTISIRLDIIDGDPTWKDSIENRPANTILNKGLLLTSDKLITAYYDDANTSNPAIWPMKGKNALGTEFYIPGQNNYANQTNDGSEAFDIVATEDNTLITITPTLDIVGHPAGLAFEIILNKGETYSARTLITTASASLMGSHVVSDKPIAITISDDSIITGGWDIIGDQLVPINLLGFEYIVIKGFADNNPPNNNDERIYILATMNSTDVYIDGSPTPAASLNAGEQYNYGIPTASNTVSINATNPVYVYHLSGHPGEAGASILPQDSCTGSIKIGFARSSNSAFAMLILTRDGNQSGFLLNGDNSIITAASFNVVPGTGNEWYYYRQNNMPSAQVPVGANLLENTIGKFHLGIINNVGASSEYGYFSDFSTLYLGADASICPGDSVELDAGANMTSYAWYRLINGSWSLVGSNRFYTINDSGSYSCVVNGNFCTLMDTINIGYYPNATVDLGPDTTICQGTTITFDPGSFVDYMWSNGYSGPTLTTGVGGEWWVRVTNNNDCVARDTVMLYIDSLPQANNAIIGPDTVCQQENGVYYYIDSLHFATTYNWALPLGASGSSDTAEITLDFSSVASSGTLSVYAQNHCGNGPDITFPITVKLLPGPAGFVNGPDTVCQTESGVMYTTHSIDDATSYIWTLPAGATITSGTGNDTIYVNFSTTAASGDIIVCGQSDCGFGDSTWFPLVVNPFPVPAGAITGNDTVCQGSTNVQYSVDTIVGVSAYIWTLPPGASVTSGDSTRSILVSFDSTAQTGNLVVKGYSDCGIGDSSLFSVTVNPIPVPAGAITGEDTVCQGQSGVVYNTDLIQHATSYIWTLPMGVSIVSGAGTNQITVDYLASSQSGMITVNGYNDTCGDGRHSVFAVHVNPLPFDAGTIIGPDTVCQNQEAVVYSIPLIQEALSYVWDYTGTGVTITNNEDSITLDFSPAATSGTLSVRGLNNCGLGVLSPAFPIHVNPRPDVTLQVCQPITTREAQPFRLRGGIPLGGIYSGEGTAAGWFTPSLIPLGTDTVYLTYSYVNMYGCTFADSLPLYILPTAPHSCGDTVIDVRDSTKYPTVLIGSQCWMAANLNYGNPIASSQVQRDNCLHEKYCYNDNPLNCSSYGGLYQWDEVMNYDDTPSLQGLCPPGWHIPTESEWTTLFNQYINNGFAGSALKSRGYSGFDALVTGIGFHMQIWKFPITDPILRSILFWSSTVHSPSKAWAHGMNEVTIDTDYSPSVSLYPALRSNGFAVRCLKD